MYIGLQDLTFGKGNLTRPCINYWYFHHDMHRLMANEPQQENAELGNLMTELWSYHPHFLIPIILCYTKDVAITAEKSAGVPIICPLSIKKND